MCDSSKSVSELQDVISSGTHLCAPKGGSASPPVSKHSEGDGMNGTTSSLSSSSSSVKARSQLLPSLERMGARPLPAAPSVSSTRRSRLQRQQEVCEQGGNVSHSLSAEISDKGSLTPAMRKKYLKELFLHNGRNSGFGSILLPSKNSYASSGGTEENDPCSVEDTSYTSYWALDPMEHAWMLSVVDGNYETILTYLSSDMSLLTRKDFVSGYTALHWLAKYGKDETLIKLLKYAEKEGCRVDVNLRGSGGLTPLHVATMHSQFMVVKLLVGAFSAKTDIMDYSGRRAWQYLKSNAPLEMKELLGAWDDEHASVGAQNVNNNSSSAEAPVTPQSNIPEEEPKDAFDRRNDSSGRFGSFKKLFFTVQRYFHE
ncbi:ankyrin repeat domain-containing protein SOWAHC [Engraulis encrasicolus]|uniref:ankyrin repeat domain-containing protein SOWAHC n=1 Tax=Engraulis encrasicolus TaxID=184585 RepID=UPI002FCED36D